MQHYTGEETKPAPVREPYTVADKPVILERKPQRPGRVPMVTGIPTYPDWLGGRCFVEVKHAATGEVLATTCAHADWGLANESAVAVMRMMEQQP